MFGITPNNVAKLRARVQRLGSLNNKLVVTGFAADPAERNPCAQHGCTGHGTQGVTVAAPEAAAEGHA